MGSDFVSSFQNATPTIVFNNIFSNLSPGFLWVVCRRVCKSWKSNVENGSALYSGIEKYGLLQFSIYKLDDNFKYEELQIYRCKKYDMNKGIITFGSLGIEPCILDNDTVYRGDETRHKFIRIGKISNGLFPGGQAISSKGIRLDLEPGELRVRGKVRVFNKPTGEVHDTYPYDSTITMTQELVDEFHSKPLKKEFSEYQTYAEGQSFPVALRFDRPKVDLQLVYGPYIFKCRYITSMKQSDVDTSDSGSREWDLHYRLIINEIEIDVRKLCNWRCLCRKDNVWSTCDLETLSSWRCPSLFPPTDKKYNYAFVEHEVYSALTQEAREMLKNYKTPVWKDLLPRWFQERKKKEREHVRNTLLCLGCYKWPPSKRCTMNLCKYCCRSTDCKMHGSCVVCRLEMYEKTVLREQKRERGECLRYYGGVKCSERRRAAWLAWQLHCKGYEVQLIRKFPKI